MAYINGEKVLRIDLVGNMNQEVDSIREIRAGNSVQFWVGEKADYDKISDAEKVANCVYIVTDDTTAADLQNELLKTTEKVKNITEEQPIVDYIVEQDSEMHEDEHYGWTWRKWKSGLAELWGACDVETAFTTKVAEGHWEGESFPNLAYPFPLINENGTIHVQFSIYYTAAKHHISYCAWYHGGGITTPTYTPYSATQITDVERITGRYYIMGRWKEEE